MFAPITHCSMKSIEYINSSIFSVMVFFIIDATVCMNMICASKAQTDPFNRIKYFNEFARFIGRALLTCVHVAVSVDLEPEAK